MRTSAVLCMLAACLLLATSVVAADARNIIRGGVVNSMPTGDYSDMGLTIEADSAMGLGIAYERKITDLIGVNFDLAWTNHDVKVKGRGLDVKFGEGAMMPLTIAALFHPLKQGIVDYYIGPAFSYVMYDDFSIDSQFRSLLGTSGFSVDNEFTWALQTGADIKFNDTWGLNLDLKYIQTSAEDLDINPFNFCVGVAARF